MFFRIQRSWKNWDNRTLVLPHPTILVITNKITCLGLGSPYKINLHFPPACWEAENFSKQLECLLQLKELIWNVAQEEVAARPWAMTMIPTNPPQKLTTNVKPGHLNIQKLGKETVTYDKTPTLHLPWTSQSSCLDGVIKKYTTKCYIPMKRGSTKIHPIC